MRIRVQHSTNAGSQTVSLSDTLRYLSTMGRYGFKPVSYWVSRGLERQNYVGQGYQDFNCMCIPCSFSLSSGAVITKVTLRMKKVWASNHANRTFRWAISPYRTDSSFKGIGAANSMFLKGQGVFTVDSSGGSVHEQTFTFPVNNLTENIFYIYLWRNNDSYGNIHVSDDVVVTVYARSGNPEWVEATPYIWKNGRWNRATAYVRKNNQWKSG